MCHSPAQSQVHMDAVDVLLHGYVVLADFGGHRHAVAAGEARIALHEKVDLNPHCCVDGSMVGGRLKSCSSRARNCMRRNGVTGSTASWSSACVDLKVEVERKRIRVPAQSVNQDDGGDMLE